MRIALVIPYNPLEEVGGLELGTALLAADLKKCGHEVTIISKGQSGHINDVPVWGYPDFAQLCHNLITCGNRSFDIVHWLEIFPDLGEVELQGMTSGLLRAIGVKVIMMVATSGNLETRGKGYLITPLLKQTMDAYVISNPTQLIEFASCDIRDNIHIIGFGIDTNVFRPVTKEEKKALRESLGLPLDKVLCLFMGRFVARKRPDFLLRAWQSMEEVYDRAELVVVGSGMDQHDSIEENVRTLADSTKSAHFRGITKTPEQYYQACDMLLLPSEREGQPNVMMEMMACGNPVIGSDIPGLREIIAAGKNGLIFPKDNRVLFQQAMHQLIDNELLRIELGHSARELIVSVKDVRVVTEQYLQLYEGRALPATLADYDRSCSH